MGVMNDMLCLYGPSLLASSYHSAVEHHVSTLGGMTRHNIYSGGTNESSECHDLHILAFTAGIQLLFCYLLFSQMSL